jgi:hypothetical protein
MKNKIPLTISLLLFSAVPVVAQKSQSFNLHELAGSKGINVYNRQMTLIEEKGYKGIRLNPDLGEGVAWINGIEFSNGTIEVDVRGKNEKQRSFVGLAFHGKDNTTFDAIYLRPFQFQEQNEELKKRSVQYISLPDHPWRTLRENSPGKYESALNSIADPNGWVHMKIVIKDKTVSAYINGASEPCLLVEKLTALKKGSIGFYVADVSGGDFANLTVIKSE